VPDPQDSFWAALADRYVLERELGRGGMATVYLARDLKHDRLVALKVLHPELAGALGPERFLREIRTAARLDHPHILPVFDSGEAGTREAGGGLLWYTMPYVEGESLRERLRREVQLPLEEALRITREVADALDCAHRHGVVHRDVKPENVLVGEGHARVADFGVAQAVEAAGGTQLTGTGMAVGTPAYMSPEQASAGQVDARTDVYALGCVLYEMLAGESPFTGPTPQAVIARRLTETPRPLSATRERIPAHVEEAVKRALARAPADRFQTAAEFAHALATGYVTDPGSATTSAPRPASSPPPASRRSRRRPKLTSALAISFGLLVIAAVGMLMWQRARSAGAPSVASAPSASDGPAPAAGSSRQPASVERSVAVLPFTNLSPNRQNEYFSDGMTEELITALGKVEGLRVAARASSFAFKGKPLDVGEVSRKLNVGAVLDGSVRRSGRRLRVTAELVRASDGARLWADRYDRELRDVFQVQDELARAIVGALRVPLRLSGRPDTALVRTATADPAAHDLYLQGRFQWNQRTYEALRRAASYFERAAARDPAYAEAYAGLADAYVILPQYGPVPPRDAFAKAERAAERALALDSTLAEAHTSLAAVRMYAYDWRGAEAEFRRAIALNPNYATAHHWYSAYLGGAGRLDEALAEIEQAQVLDPLSRIISANVGGRLALHRRYDDALRQLRAALELDPNFAAAHEWLCWVYIMKRTPREATGPCERAAALTGGNPGLGPLAYAYAASGERARATTLLRQLEARSRREYVSPWAIAIAHLGLGDTAGAFEWLDRGVVARDPNLTGGLSAPFWDPLRADPRFVRLRERMGLPP